MRGRGLRVWSWVAPAGPRIEAFATVSSRCFSRPTLCDISARWEKCCWGEWGICLRGVPGTAGGAPGPSCAAFRPDSSTGPLRQEIPLHLQLPYLLVRERDWSDIVLGILLHNVAREPLDRSIHAGLNLPVMGLIPSGQQLVRRFPALHRLKSHLGLESRHVPWALR